MSDEQHERLVALGMLEAPRYLRALLRAATEFREIEVALGDTKAADYHGEIAAVASESLQRLEQLGADVESAGPFTVVDVEVPQSESN